MSGSYVMTTATPEATAACGEALGRLAIPGDVVLLTGDLGAGKTQLTKGIASGLGVAEPVTSPTFNILLVHEGRLPLYHFDLYRLDDAVQLDDIDYHATIEADGLAIVEWGDRFEEARPLDGLLVSLRTTGDTARLFEALPLGPRGELLATEWLAECGAVADVGVDDSGDAS